MAAGYHVDGYYEVFPNGTDGSSEIIFCNVSQGKYGLFNEKAINLPKQERPPANIDPLTH